MAATFDPALPTSKDHIRLHLGDIHSLGVAGAVTNPLVQDELITSLVTQFGFREALAQLADMLAARYAQKPNEYQQQDGVRVRWSYRVTEWQSLAKAARRGDIPVPGQRTTRRGYKSGIIDTTLTDFRSD